MTLPVPVFEGASLLNTRRTIGGVFHFSPNPVINRIVKFTLAYTAEKYDIGLYSAAFLSNHHHETFYDPHGRHPEFRRDLHSLLTRSVNQYRGEGEAKWSPDHKSPVLLHDVEALLNGIAYNVANPPRHDLVEIPEAWPGVISLVEDLAGPPQTIEKPSGFYDPEGKVPDTVILRFVKPPVLADWTDDEYRREIARRVEEKCRTARESRGRRGAHVVGREAILGQSHTDSSRSQPKLQTRNPRVACALKTLRIALLLWLRRFRKEYRRARQAFEDGEAGVEFPFGTYLLARRYGVNCSSVGPPQPETA